MPEPGSPREPDPDADLQFEQTVIVAATRSDRRLQDQPLRVEVVDREDIEEKALMTPGSVAMLLGETTGLRVQTTAPSIGAANVRVQGLRGRYAQLLADGLPLYGAAGDSFSLLQVPPLDLEQVEIVKGAASALYGPAALGGVINLVSRRPREVEQEVLLNATSQRGRDATLWLAGAPRGGWGWTLIAGYHGQSPHDPDGDGWADLPRFDRAVVRPRLVYDSGTGRTAFLTAGAIVEDRTGGTLPGRAAPDGRPFLQALDTRRGDAGGVVRWATGGGRIVALRGSFARLAQGRRFGDVEEHGTRDTWFAETSVTGAIGRHTWVAGAAFQQERFDPRTPSPFAYRFSVPGVFVQDEFDLGPAAALATSVRLDAHSQYGAFLSPRVSLLARPAPGWTARLSAGTAVFAPVPFTEETDETGLARLVPPAGDEARALDALDAERARGASIDVAWTAGPYEISGTLYGSIVDRAVHLALAGPAAVALVNADEPTRTWGTEVSWRYRRGGLLVMLTHNFTRSTEADVDRGGRRGVPLTPAHAASLNVIWEDERWGRAGLEAYYTGAQALDDDPYLDTGRRYVLVGGLVERRLGALRVFVNVENLADVRQTKTHPLVRPVRRPDGRWTVDAWAPLDGRVANAGVRIAF